MNTKQKVLVVDDDSCTREILLLILQNAGYEVTVLADELNAQVVRQSNFY